MGCSVWMERLYDDMQRSICEYLRSLLNAQILKVASGHLQLGCMWLRTMVTPNFYILDTLFIQNRGLIQCSSKYSVCGTQVDVVASAYHT